MYYIFYLCLFTVEWCKKLFYCFARLLQSIPPKLSFLVITGSVITTNIKSGNLYATVSILNVYKEGNLAIQQAGKNLSAKIFVVCKQCPVIRRGK